MTLDEAAKALPGLFEQQNYDACANLAIQVVKIQPHNPAALYFLGRIAELRGAPEEASKAYRHASLSFPYDTTLAEAALRTTPPEQRPTLTGELNERKAQIEGFQNKPALELVSNPAGKMYVPVFPDNDVISQAIRAGQVFDQNIIQCASEYIRKGTAVLDVGANLGQMTLQFSKMVGTDGKVFAIEADDYIHHILCRNIAVNGLSNVTTINKAVHEVGGSQVFFPDQDFARFSSFGSYGIDPNAKTGRSVQTVTIDSLHIEEPLSFMKVDVQGCDLFAMRGARETILRNKMPIVFEYEEQFQQEFRTTFQDYVDFVLSIDYRFVKTIDSINFLVAAR